MGAAEGVPVWTERVEMRGCGVGGPCGCVELCIKAECA